MHLLASEELIDFPNVTLLQLDALKNKNQLNPVLLETVREKLAVDGPGGGSSWWRTCRTTSPRQSFRICWPTLRAGIDDRDDPEGAGGPDRRRTHARRTTAP